MWTYVIAFTEDLGRFLMVRSRKRGGWEMPGGGSRPDEKPLETSEREFMEETGHALISDKKWHTKMGEGFVFFGIIGGGDTEKRNRQEITEVGLFYELPGDLAYPSHEYMPLISRGKEILGTRII